MSKYLLEYVINNKALLARVEFVANRQTLSNVLSVCQAGAEGLGIELELGAMEREEVSLVNGCVIRHIKRTRRNWIHDPVQAVEALRDFRETLHVQLIFAGHTPKWYQDVVLDVPAVFQDFSQIVKNQLEFALEIIGLKAEIEEALAKKDQEQFRKKARLYRKMRESCLWDF